MEMSANPPNRVSRAYIGMGGNQGDVTVTLRSAVSGLNRLGRVIAVSPVYVTEPVGVTEQPRFLNAVAELATRLAPIDLLDGLLRIEADHGRVREQRFGPRTLDLDLLWYEGVAADGPRLTLPHPRAAQREFVLRPLADLAPALVLGEDSVAALLERLPPLGVHPTGIALMP